MNSIIGIVAILFVAWLLSTNRKNIKLRTVSFAFALQVLFALLVLYVPAGRDALNSVSSVVSNLINYGQEGIAFLFGNLATGASPLRSMFWVSSFSFPLLSQVFITLV